LNTPEQEGGRKRLWANPSFRTSWKSGWLKVPVPVFRDTEEMLDEGNKTSFLIFIL
jgi:hypothetical protein